jgi:hypothetical protein
VEISSLLLPLLWSAFSNSILLLCVSFQFLVYFWDFCVCVGSVLPGGYADLS